MKKIVRGMELSYGKTHEVVEMTMYVPSGAVDVMAMTRDYMERKFPKVKNWTGLYWNEVEITEDDARLAMNDLRRFNYKNCLFYDDPEERFNELKAAHETYVRQQRIAEKIAKYGYDSPLIYS